jgi:hypothetical protein
MIPCLFSTGLEQCSIHGGGKHLQDLLIVDFYGTTWPAGSNSSFWQLMNLKNAFSRNIL